MDKTQGEVFDKAAFREKVLKKTLMNLKRFKAEARSKISRDMIESAVDKAIKGHTTLDIAAALAHPERFCEKCGECCRINNPILVKFEEILQVSIFLGIDLPVFIANYVKELKDGWYSLRTNPCPFLKDNFCTIYSVRPFVCRTFPLKQKKDDIRLTYYVYCNFVVNVTAEAAFSSLLLKLLKTENQQLYSMLRRCQKSELSNMPEDKVQQISFLIEKIFKGKKR